MTLSDKDVNTCEIDKTKKLIDRKCYTHDVFKKAECVEDLSDYDVHFMEFKFSTMCACDMRTQTQDELEKKNDRVTKEFVETVINPSAKLFNDFIEAHPDYTVDSIYHNSCSMSVERYANKKRLHNFIDEFDL